MHAHVLTDPGMAAITAWERRGVTAHVTYMCVIKVKVTCDRGIVKITLQVPTTHGRLSVWVRVYMCMSHVCACQHMYVHATCACHHTCSIHTCTCMYMHMLHTYMHMLHTYMYMHMHAHASGHPITDLSVSHYLNNFSPLRSHFSLGTGHVQISLRPCGRGAQHHSLLHPHQPP